ncbi:MAG: adenylosuccinate lyase [Flavobacteriales bacterium]|nr:adenylosuccinate lyase [Flavobacteriales bacterium]
MQLNELNAISPIDGRYRSKTKALAEYMSEFGLIKYRVLVEVEYLIALSKGGIAKLSPLLNADVQVNLRKMVENFSEADALVIKETEKTTNHDVKAVEYFVKGKLAELNLTDLEEFVHFGLTSQDINNTAIPYSLNIACQQVVMKQLAEVVQTLTEKVNEYKEIPMLAKTHGQPASPTRLGKEFAVFVARLNEQIRQFNELKWPGKFGGATGNFNAHFVAYPELSWADFANDFVEKLGLQRSEPTTQIEHYDNLAAKFDCLRRINTILIDFCRDIWTYISMEYFKQRIVGNEVGSSAMPHKVNPIDFENAEGNLGMANAVLNHLSEKLPISRLQRDLTDSTVLRNVGVPLGHMVIAFQSIQKGMSKLLLNEAKIKQDLDENWAVVAEAIQTILRREGYPKPYETLKGLTRTNSKIDQKAIHQFIDTLEISNEIKEEMKRISPFNYTGM